MASSGGEEVSMISARVVKVGTEGSDCANYQYNPKDKMENVQYGARSALNQAISSL